MSSPVEIQDLGDGLTLKIYYDDDCQNPLTDIGPDGAGIAYCWWDRHNLGHYKNNPYKEPRYLLEALADEYDIEHYGNMDMDELLAALDAAGLMFVPLYVYEHGGITMSTGSYSCPWDSGQAGWWVITPQELKTEWNGDREYAAKYVDAAIREYAAYLEGACYGYVIEDEDGDDVESCWGFIGWDHKESGLMEEAMAAAKRVKIERAEAAAAAAIHKQAVYAAVASLYEV